MAYSIASIDSAQLAPATRRREDERAPVLGAEPLDGSRRVPRDRVSLSDEARARAGGEAGPATAGEGAEGVEGAADAEQAGAAEQAKGSGQSQATGQPKSRGELSPEEQLAVTQLVARDREVRAHEAAHMAAGGALAGGASFSYQTGPDGRSYAVGGEVPIRMSAGRTPDETIAIARQIRRAALAPANPSGQDLSVAAAAASMEQAAQARKAAEASQAYQKNAKKPGAGASGQDEQGGSAQRALAEPAAATAAAA
ncbi:MAG: putative metalloprotease CJM1_0395 family protein [Anaeromyxobacter sp.]